MFYEPKYTVVNFEGTIGDFIKKHRKAKKINSIELSKTLNKSDSYISHIENGRYKKFDYETMVDIFKAVGIKEEMIEDLLFYFGVYSPRIKQLEEDYEEMEREQLEIYIRNLEDPVFQEQELQRNIELLEQEEEENRIRYEEYERDNREELDTYHDENPFHDILEQNILNITQILNEIANQDDSLEAFNLITGLSNNFSKSKMNSDVYRFLRLLLAEDYDSLDNEAMTKIINTLYEEVNRKALERIGFGKPPLKKLIKSIN